MNGCTLGDADDYFCVHEEFLILNKKVGGSLLN
jgi:hypothetical protein